MVESMIKHSWPIQWRHSIVTMVLGLMLTGCGADSSAPSGTSRSATLVATDPKANEPPPTSDSATSEVETNPAGTAATSGDPADTASNSAVPTTTDSASENAPSGKPAGEPSPP